MNIALFIVVCSDSLQELWDLLYQGRLLDQVQEQQKVYTICNNSSLVD